MALNAVYFLSWLLYYEFNFFSYFFTGGILALQLFSGLLTHEIWMWNNAPVFNEEVSLTGIYILIFIGISLVVIGGLLAFVFSLKAS